MAASSYLRFPHLAQDLLTFIADDDVWLAPATGGRATRLTADRAPAAFPHLSPDAQHVAWSSNRGGAWTAHTVAVDGGTPERLTYWGERVFTTGWLSPEEVLVASFTGADGSQLPWIHAVRLTGEERTLPYGPATRVSIAPDGAVLLNNLYFSDPGWWKRYLGGAGGKIWLDRDGTGQFARILGDVGNHLVNPMFVGDRIAFLSDHEGVGALYSTTRDGTDLRKHTDHGPLYARHATTDGKRVVYQCAGEIWLLASLDAAPEKLELTLGGARAGREPIPVSAADWLGAYGLCRTGRVAAAEVRGTVHWLPAEDGPARTLLAEPGVRGRLPAVVPGKAAVICVSDRGGEDGLNLIPADGAAPRRIGHGQLGRVFELAVSPDATTAAVSSEDGRLLLVDLAEEAGDDPITELTRSEIDETHGLVFSPDSRYLAWAQPWETRSLSARADAQIRLARLADRTITDVTAQRFDSRSPAFTHDGKHLAFLSDQTYDPVHDTKLFDIGFLPGVRPYLVTLAADTPSPFAPELNGRPADGNSGGESGAGPDATPEPLRVDLERIAQRIVPFPVEAGSYSDLRAVQGGVAWLSRTGRGDLDERWEGAATEPPKPTLYRYDLAQRKRTVLVEALDSYAVSGNGARIAYRTDGGLKIKAADTAAEDGAIPVDLDRIRVRLDPAAEWSQMYDEAWRLVRDNFWRPDMGGIDWPAMAGRYRPMLARAGCHDDFMDVLWELQGELGVSHAYVAPPPRPGAPESRPGLLGADLERGTDGGWRITRIVPGESSVAGARSPLAAPGVAAEPGDVLAAVDGRPVDPARGPNPLLAGKAGKPVELTLRRAGSADRRVAVVPLASELTLRYHDRIAARRAAVREMSGGRLGYVHVPDMDSPGWAEFHRGLPVELRRDGLIFDLRENRGGHTSQLVLEKLARKVTGWILARQAGTTSYPHDAPRGPVVTLVDEYTASDGDIAANAVRAYGIGPLVGTRTWGGVVGYDRDRALVDGTTVTQPKLACWFDQPGWSIENHGVDPDVEVPITPQDWAAGRDPQLETAVRMALEALETHPPVRPPVLPPLPQ